MPTAHKLSNDPRDRIIDYLTTSMDLLPDGILIMEGRVSTRTVSVADRPKDLRGEQRRFYMRISVAGGVKTDLTRVYNSEASVIAALDAIDKGQSIKRKPRGVALARMTKATTKKGSPKTVDLRTGLG